MGQAFTALSDDEAASSYNPAGVANTLQPEISASHVQWFQGINLEHVGIVLPGGRVSYLADLTWLQMGGLEKTVRDNPSASDPLLKYSERGTFAPLDITLGLGLAKSFANGISLGFRADGYLEQVDSQNSFGAEGNLGAQYRLQDLSAGLAVQHISTNSADMVRAGISYGFLDGIVNAALDAVISNDDSASYSAGLEGWAYDLVALRAGYIVGPVNQYTAGLGIRWRGFALDYAYVPHPELGVTNRLTATYSWGLPVSRIKVDKAMLNESEIATLSPIFPAVSKLRWWKVEVMDQEGRVLRTLQGRGPAPTSVVWNGKDGNGIRVLPGKVIVQAKGLYRRGIVSRPETQPLKVVEKSEAIPLTNSPRPRTEIYFSIGDTQFQVGKAEMKSSNVTKIDEVAREIKVKWRKGTWIQVIGHTDNQPVLSANFANNQELSKARANAVAEALKVRLGRDATWVVISGKGDSQPLADNGTEAGRAMNRRVEIVVQTSLP